MQRVLDFHRQGHISHLAPIKTILAAEIPDLVSCAHAWTQPGKVVVLMPGRPENPPAEFKNVPLRFRPDRAYLCVGNSGKALRAVATWLVERGARHVVFLSGPTNNVLDDDRFEAELTSMGCTTVRVTGDVTREEDIVSAIRSVDIPFAGVLHLTHSSKVSHGPFSSTLTAHK